jgi:hypothetical protein
MTQIRLETNSSSVLVSLTYNWLPFSANTWTTVSGDTTILGTAKGTWSAESTNKRLILKDAAGIQLCYLEPMRLDGGLGNPLTTLSVGDSGSNGTLLRSPTIALAWAVVAV